MVTDSDFHTLIATLQSALDLRLTKSQRTKLKTLCQEIAGVEAESGIPPSRLKEEADAKKAAIERAEAAEQRGRN
jgi:hypothetical protein